MWPLWKATKEDLNLTRFHRAFASAGPLKREDIILKADEKKKFNDAITLTICEIIVTYGGDKLSTKIFKDELEKRRQLVSAGYKIEAHKTPLHPMTVFDIDESTIIGNGDVAKAIYEEAGVFDTSLFNSLVKILGGDQLSIARLRALNNI
jgi:hypothetical protein